MREKIIARLKELFIECDGEFAEYADVAGLSVPESPNDIENLTDEELIKLLEIYGQFLG